MKIAIAGKGGAGKTTLAGTLALLLSKHYSIIAVDSDPSMNLHTSIGIKNPKPISTLKDLITKRTLIAQGVYNLNPKVDDIIEKYATKKKNIKLIVMGTVEKGGGGCICPENAFVRALLRHLVLKRGEVLILDTEAGVEHLGRKTAEGFDIMLIVCEPSTKAIETANRIYRLSREIGIKKIYGVGNKAASRDQEKFIEDGLDFDILEHIPFDEIVMKADMQGIPLAEISPLPISVKAIKKIVKKIKSGRV